MNRIPIITLIILAGCFFSCEEPDYPDNIYSENPEVLPDPTISNVSPADSAFSGIGIVTITGQNFSTRVDQNLVYFNGTTGIVQSASATELVVKAPNIVADSVKIQVAVIGAYEFGEWNNYGLYPPVIKWGTFDPLGTNLWGLEIDNDENMVISDRSNKILYRVFSNGEVDSLEFGDYSPRLQAFAIRLGPSDTYYMAMNHKSVYTIEEGGREDAWADLPNRTKAYALDFASTGILYAGGQRNVLYQIDINSGETDFVPADTLPDGILINSVRVFEDYVYMIGDYSGDDSLAVQNGIWRCEIISADSVAPAELVIDWDDALGANATKPLDLSFDASGNMFVGVDYMDPSCYECLGPGLYLVQAPYTTPEPFYQEVFKAPGSKMSWGNDKYLYINNQNSAVPPDGVTWDYSPTEVKGPYRVDMDRLGAPYHGRSL